MPPGSGSVILTLVSCCALGLLISSVTRVLLPLVTVVGLKDLTTVGGLGRWTSTAPESQIVEPLKSPSTGRPRPRWSTAGQPAFTPPSIAGLPVLIMCVCVGPPLFA